MSDSEGFLGRWSRLKQEAPEEVEQVAADPSGLPEEPISEEDTRSDEEILAEHGLPHPDDLKPGDDIQGFMDAAIPDRLRRIALRKLWRSNPVLANLDGLVEYGEDYTDAATVVENLQTAYQVGKGMLGTFKDPESEGDDDKVLADEVAEETEEPTEKDSAEEVEITDEFDSEDMNDPAEFPGEIAINETAPVPEDDPVAPPRRRMAFRYD